MVCPSYEASSRSATERCLLAAAGYGDVGAGERPCSPEVAELLSADISELTPMTTRLADASL